jgi:hypothetical protein
MSVPVAFHAPAFVEVPRAPRARVVPVLAAIALLALAIEGWSPRLLSDGGRDAVATVDRHAPTPVPGRPGVLEVRDPAYRAEFDAEGFSYLPAGATTPLGV